MDNRIDKAIVTFLRGQVDVLNERIRMKWDVYASQHAGFTTWNVHEPLFKQDENSIHILLQYSGLAAWIAEYGSGSQMDTLSPYYDSYSMNPLRKNKGNAFLGRKEGDIVYRPDGSSYTSSGNMEGLNLEWRLGKRFSPFVAEKAQHIIRNEINMWAQEIKPELKQLIRREIIGIIKEGARA